MAHDFRDRDGGHKPAELDIGDVTGWTPHFRRFAKRMTRREMRREHVKITSEALNDYEDELEEQRMWEESAYTAIEDDYDYQADFDAEDDLLRELERDYRDDAYSDPYFDDPYHHDFYFNDDTPERCPECGRVL